MNKTCLRKIWKSNRIVKILKAQLYCNPNMTIFFKFKTKVEHIFEKIVCTF